jgi:arylsulfatase A
VAVRQNLNRKKQKAGSPIHTELYDLGHDIGETQAVATQQPDVLHKLEAIMQQQHQPSKLFPMPALDSQPAKN